MPTLGKLLHKGAVERWLTFFPNTSIPAVACFPITDVLLASYIMTKRGAWAGGVAAIAHKIDTRW